MKRKLSLWLAILMIFTALPLTAMAAPMKVPGIKSPQDLYLNGQKTPLYGYNIQDENYYRLRDLAKLLAGEVDFNARGDHLQIHLTLGETYQDLGQKDHAATENRVTALEKFMDLAVISLNNTTQRQVKVYNINGFNYFRLRDMGEILGFDVTYDQGRNIAHIYTGAQPPAPQPEEPERVILGNERIFDDYHHLIAGKRVGLITNQTGVDAEGVPTEDRLLQDPSVKLVALYSPEHGLDGKTKAGAWVESYTDKRLGLPVYSLYGQTRKPTPKMLQGVDVLLYDMQDIGSRTYTYISTLNYAMRAAKENNLPIIVLDRPNPLGGEIVEGYLREDRFQSFVGVDRMPMAHGMTAGELGQYFNRNIGANLTVVPMKNWTRDMVWQDTGLPFKQTSPNIPTLESAILYMATGSGEGTGIGQSDYFHWVGGKNINSQAYANALNSAGLQGVRFEPQSKGNRGGVNVIITDPHTINPARVGIYTLATANRMRPITVPQLKKPYHMFYLIMGNENYARDFRARKTPEQIVQSYQKDVDEFKQIRAQYLIYK